MSDTKISKAMSLILRHEPRRFNVAVDAEGWAEIPALVAALASMGHEVDDVALRHIVAKSPKQRFEIDGERVRAYQGHSIDVSVPLREAQPPDALWHGTPTQAWERIRQEGLKPMKRHHVHLSADRKLAWQTGARRRGSTVLLRVHARAMTAAGHKLWVTPNEVWLADAVPPDFLERTTLQAAEE